MMESKLSLSVVIDKGTGGTNITRHDEPLKADSYKEISYGKDIIGNQAIGDDVHKIYGRVVIDRDFVKIGNGEVGQLEILCQDPVRVAEGETITLGEYDPVDDKIDWDYKPTDDSDGLTLEYDDGLGLSLSLKAGMEQGPKAALPAVVGRGAGRQVIRVQDDDWAEQTRSIGADGLRFDGSSATKMVVTRYQPDGSENTIEYDLNGKPQFFGRSDLNPGDNTISRDWGLQVRHDQAQKWVVHLSNPNAQIQHQNDAEFRPIRATTGGLEIYDGTTIVMGDQRGDTPYATSILFELPNHDSPIEDFQLPVVRSEPQGRWATALRWLSLPVRVLAKYISK